MLSAWRLIKNGKHKERRALYRRYVLELSVASYHISIEEEAGTRNFAIVLVGLTICETSHTHSTTPSAW